MKQSSKQNTIHYMRAIGLGAILGLTLVIAFSAGYIVRGQGRSLDTLMHIDNEEISDYSLVDEVQALIDDVYLREQPTYTQRQYGAIRGMLATLDDPNTFFIEPAVAQNEADALAGTYGGIGVQLKRNSAGEFVLYPYPESPAAEVGIRNGAVLIAVDGVEITIEDQQDAIDQQMRGEVKADNGIRLTVQHPGTDDTQQFFVEFDVINVPSVVWRIVDADERIGYLQILRFTNRTPDEVRTGIETLKSDGIRSLILDLRNNSGGLLQESVSAASEFLDGGVVVYEENQDERTALEADSGGSATDIPLVVLVNNGTASAAELVAGAIRDRNRGVLIGQRTYGKGTVQQIYSLSDGSSVHITSAEWFTPDRIPLAGVGLEPNIQMIPDENGRDVEIDEAIRHLQAEMNDDPSTNETSE